MVIVPLLITSNDNRLILLDALLREGEKGVEDIQGLSRALLSSHHDSRL